MKNAGSFFCGVPDKSVRRIKMWKLAAAVINSLEGGLHRCYNFKVQVKTLETVY